MQPSKTGSWCSQRLINEMTEWQNESTTFYMLIPYLESFTCLVLTLIQGAHPSLPILCSPTGNWTQDPQQSRQTLYLWNLRDVLDILNMMYWCAFFIYAKDVFFACYLYMLHTLCDFATKFVTKITNMDLFFCNMTTLERGTHLENFCSAIK